MIREIRTLAAARPFVPFTIYMANGRQIHVPTSDHILAGRVRVVVLRDDDTFEFLSGLLMTGVSADTSALLEGNPA